MGPALTRRCLLPSGRKSRRVPAYWVRRAELGVAFLLVEDIFSGDWWVMAIPAVLYAVQNNVL